LTCAALCINVELQNTFHQLAMHATLRKLLIAGTAVNSAAFGQTELTFAPQQLSGWWAESYNTDATCGPQNLRVKHEFSNDGKRLRLRFDRKWKTELGESEGFEATVLASTERTLVVRYDGESRKKRNGQAVEWELSIVAPGVYRWRETEWPAGKVNTVVGIKCSN
jgi:hypothetical protein